MLTGSYKGATNSCNRHGFGFYKYGRGFYRYEGEWKEGQKHGFGKLVMADGGFYTGQFEHGEITGIGTQYYANTGNTYEGKFCLGERQGQGIMRYKNGSAYCGEWVANARQGQGTLFDTEGGCYCGRFWASKKTGTGRYRNDKIVYDGDWCEDLFDGIGKLEFSTGQTYEGCFHAGKPHGHGTLIRAHRNAPFFVGLWEHGKPCSEAAYLTVCSNIPSKEPLSSKQAEFLPFGEADFSLKMPTTVRLSNQATVLNYAIPQLQMIEGFALTLCVQSRTNTIFIEESNRQLLLWIGRRVSDEREASVVIKFHVSTPTSPILDFLSQTGATTINSPMGYSIQPLGWSNVEPASSEENHQECTDNVEAKRIDFEDVDSEINSDGQTSVVAQDISAQPELIPEPQIREVFYFPQVTGRGLAYWSKLSVDECLLQSYAVRVEDNSTDIISGNATKVICTNETDCTSNTMMETKAVKSVHSGTEADTRVTEFVLVVEDVSPDPEDGVEFTNEYIDQHTLRSPKRLPTLFICLNPF
ncbi:hypothetical protein EG68_00109 [Paragonimus skrjabini miyazakii]|uniref:MORN repeat-containing protein 1 n=1 Tax=Paragonimus skrjabini miyazakii TaxID=59628 RepID=A0A8S9ZAC3_9TREM|nr:hypothetical protein EG68_00109 [Paragonimus skrjabini miyazakii]